MHHISKKIKSYCFDANRIVLTAIFYLNEILFFLRKSWFFRDLRVDRVRTLLYPPLATSPPVSPCYPSYTN